MALLARPDHVFEAQFFETDDGPVWVNLTDYIELQEGITAGKRRQNVFDNVAPATLRACLDNSAGTFNNDKASSPFVGHVNLNVPVRLRLRWPGSPSSTANMLDTRQCCATDPGTLTADQGSLGLDPTIAAVTLDDDAADFSGTWNTRTDAADLNGTSREINTAGNVASFTFTGTKVTWVGEKQPSAGIANVQIDGGTVTQVDTYVAGSRTYQNALYVSPTLAPGQHTITITTQTTTKNAASTNYWINVDGFIVESVATPPSGQASDIVWTTGTLSTSGVGLYTGVGPSRSPDDYPIYVKPSTTYSARAVVKDDAAGIGISFAVKARLRWFAQDGTYISDTDGASVTLTGSYQDVTVTGTSPANAASVRLGFVSQTIVGPKTAAIAFNNGEVDTQSWGTKRIVTVPSSAAVGDVALIFVRTNNPNVTASITPSGWVASTVTTGANPSIDSKGRVYLFQKIIAASDVGKKYTVTTSAACGFQVLIATWDGTDTTTPVHKLATAAENTFRNTHTTASVTTTLANCWIVSAVFDTSSTTSSWGVTAGEFPRLYAFRSGGNSPTGVLWDNGAPVAAGATVGKVGTSNVSSKGASMVTVALAPATGTGPGSVTVQLGKLELVEGALGTWAQGGVWASKFTGLVDSWSETFNGELTLMEVTATDRQKILSTVTIGSAISEAIRQAGPIAYYKLNESSSGTNAQQEGGNSADVPQDTMKQRQNGTGGTIAWGEGTGPAVDGSSAVMLTPVDNSNGIGLTTTLRNPVVNASGASLVVFLNSNASAALRSVISMQDGTNGKAPRCMVQIAGTPGTNLYADANIASEAVSVYATATKATNYFDGKTHCLVGTFQIINGQLVTKLYVDGVLQVTSPGTATTLGQFPTMSMASVGNQAARSYCCGGSYSHAAYFDWALDDDTIADIATAGTTAFAGDTVDQRISRLTSWEGQSDLDLDSSVTVVGRHMPDDQSLQSAIQQAANSEGGTAYVDGDGNVTFLSRVHKESTATPLITIKANRVGPTLAKVTNDELLINKPIVKRLDTQAQSVMVNQPSIDQNGTHDKEFDTILQSNDDTLNYATYVLAFYGEPTPRCNAVEVECLTLQDWANVLQIDMWQIIRITDMPAVEQSTTLDLYIEGWELNITPDSWKLTADTSTAIPFLILNDATRGVCGAAVVGW